MARVLFVVDTTSLAVADAVVARGSSPVVEVVGAGWGLVDAASTLA